MVNTSKSSWQAVYLVPCFCCRFPMQHSAEVVSGIPKHRRQCHPCLGESSMLAKLGADKGYGTALA